MAVKLFFTDLDGTLMVNHRLDSRIRQGIETIRRQGGHVIFNTGRPPMSVWQMQPEVDWLICANGALIYDAEGELVSEKRIDPKDLRDFVMTFGSEPIEIVTKDGVYSNASLGELSRMFLKRKGLPAIPVFSFLLPPFLKSWETRVPAGTLMGLPAVKLEIHDADPEKMKRFLDRHPDLVNAPSMSGLSEITRRDATKGTAALEVLDLLQMDAGQAAAFGDGINDITLLEAIPESYAPETGSEQAKNAAAHILPMPDDHAVIRKMEELIRG